MSNISTIDGNIPRQSSEEEMSNFSRRTLRHCMCPRRYVIALLLSVLLVINQARVWSVMYSFRDPSSDQSKKMTDYPFLGHSTRLREYDGFWTFASLLVGYFLFNILGGVLISQFSSHKFLLVIVTASSILHALIPTAIKLQSTTFLWLVVIGQEFLVAPILIAVLSIWKCWAPPEERTRLITISFLGIGVEAVSTLIIAVSQIECESMSYIVGFAGLVWSLFWYNITSSSPQCDLLITDKEYFYLDNKIPSHYQEKTRLKDVPWKAIYNSKQFMPIYTCFYVLGAVIEGIKVNGKFFIINTKYRKNILIIHIPFIASFILFIIGSSFLMDFLFRKYKAKSLTIRKIFICSGFVLYGAFLLGSTSIGESPVLNALNATAYFCFAFSIPVLLRSPLDLSPPYVSILSGVAFGCYYVGQFQFVILKSSKNLESKNPMLIPVSVSSMCMAILYVYYGDDKEQSWSLVRSSQRRESRAGQ